MPAVSTATASRDQDSFSESENKRRRDADRTEEGICAAVMARRETAPVFKLCERVIASVALLVQRFTIDRSMRQPGFRPPFVRAMEPHLNHKGMSDGIRISGIRSARHAISLLGMKAGELPDRHQNRHETAT
jgi:hypothetical protein